MVESEDRLRRDVRYRWGKRYIEPREFMGYLRLLRVLDQDDLKLLEFLEREGMVSPTARVRYPDDVVRRGLMEAPWTGVSPDLPRNPAEDVWVASLALDRDLVRWTSQHPSAPVRHPLDDPAPEYGQFISRPCEARRFVAWDEFRVKIREGDGKPHYSSRGTTTYYHYWQAFAVAAALDMGVRITVNLGDEEVGHQAASGELDSIPWERKRLTVVRRGLRCLSQIQQHSSALAGVAWYAYYSNRALARAVSDHGSRFVLRGEPFEKLRAEEIGFAREACSMFDLTDSDLIKVIRWQCGQWDKNRMRGRRELSHEYKANIGSSCHLVMDAFGQTYEEMESQVGEVLGRGTPALKRVFPDWIEEERLHANATCRSVVRHWNGLGEGETLEEAVVDRFLEWVESEGLVSLYWSLRASREVGFRIDALSSAAMSHWLLALAATWEHILTVALERSGADASGTLMPKVRRAWAGVPNVTQALREHRGLARTDDCSFAEQLERIRALQGGVPRAVIPLLTATLIRNHGAHVGLYPLDTEELRDLEWQVLTAVVLSWSALHPVAD